MSASNPSHAPFQATPTPARLPAAAGRTNGLAIASLVLGILGFAVLPIVFGHVALRQIRGRGEAGAGLAIAGLVLGYLALALYALFGVLLVLGLVGGLVWWS